MHQNFKSLRELLTSKLSFFCLSNFILNLRKMKAYRNIELIHIDKMEGFGGEKGKIMHFYLKKFDLIYY